MNQDSPLSQTITVSRRNSLLRNSSDSNTSDMLTLGRNGSKLAMRRLSSSGPTQKKSLRPVVRFSDCTITDERESQTITNKASYSKKTKNPMMLLIGRIRKDSVTGAMFNLDIDGKSPVPSDK